MFGAKEEAILNVNGEGSETSTDEDDKWSSQESNEESIQLGSEDRETQPMEVQPDPLCSEVKISRKEIHKACKAWKNSVIVKLLGK
ncbi:hypothetical protein SESBI_34943 [Sesbania bispinosa]|nr:hypothetical protein SESBI_34943 [Sesbania bispinosa]